MPTASACSSPTASTSADRASRSWRHPRQDRDLTASGNKVYIHLMDSKFGECNDCLCFAARRAARGISQFYDAQLRSSGLRNTQFTLLSYLINAGRGPLTRAADYMGLERTSLSRNLQPLLAQG